MPNTGNDDVETLREVVRLLMQGKSAAEIFLDQNVDSVSLEKIKELELVVRNEEPLIKLNDKDAGRAPMLNYNVPNSTSYRGRNYIILSHPKLDGPKFEWFVDAVKN